MLFESAHIRVTAEYATATLWLGFPGEPVNALDRARLGELDAALAAVAAVRTLDVLVVRSAIPAGFCTGLHPNALGSLTHPNERAAFAWYGQQVFDRLAKLEAASVAYIDGPCLGAGFELALACDYRVCVARPTTHLGFPDRFACFGGSARARNLAGRRADTLLASGETLSGREARDLELVDVACCERRGKIELRTFLDRLESRPVKPRRHTELSGLAAERRAFARLVSHPVADPPGSPGTMPLPEVIGLLGDDPHAAKLAAEIALRGGSVVVCGDRAPVFAGIDAALRRGFITPLEAEQTRRRVRVSDVLDGFDRAGLVFVAPGHDAFRLAAVVRPRTVVCISPDELPVSFPFPRRLLRLSFRDGNWITLWPDRETDPDLCATLAAWLKPFGLAAEVRPGVEQALTRAA